MQLSVGPMSAVIAKNMDAVGKMDPYVSVTVNVITQKTSVANGAGTNPIWNDVLNFQCNPNDVVQMRLYDKDLAGSDYIGEVRVPVQEIINRGGNINSSYPFSSLNNSGTLNVQLRMLGAAGGNFSNVAAQQTYTGMQPGSAVNYAAPIASANYAAPAAGAFGAPITSSTYAAPAAFAAPIASGTYAAPAIATSMVPPTIATAAFAAPTASTAFAVPVASTYSAYPKPAVIGGIAAPAVTTNQYSAGLNLAPYAGATPGSTVYTPNPYLTHPKEHTPFWGCC